MRSRIIAMLMACCLFSVSVQSAYLFVYFTGNRKYDEQIRYAISEDGYNFRALNGNRPVIYSEKISSTGGVRDPHILRGADGKTFYMVVTDMVSAKGWNSNRAMVLLKSTDLVNWTSSVVNMQTAFPGNENLLRVWAPQTIYDEEAKKYMIYFSMKHGNDPDKIYYAYANKDFTALESAPKQLFFKPDNGACIDGDIVKLNNKYHLVFKTEGSGAGLKIATSDKLTEGYVLDDKYIQQTKEAVEGAGIFKLDNNDGYILMYDVYIKGRYQFTHTKDFKTFTVVDDKVSMDFHPRHGTVISITDQEAARLKAQYGFIGPSKKVFELSNADFKLSPHTGMTRQHWKDAALYMLKGAFSYIKTLDDPMKFPKQEGKSYPRNPGQVPTEKLEGLCRTLFMAAPLLKDDPNLVVNNIRVADYYRHQILNLINPSHESYIKPRAKNGGPSQNLVEFGALAMSLSVIPEVLWEPLTQSQKDSLAAIMISYGDGPTVPSNWKFFNIFVLSFFKDKGYPVNEKLLVEYLDKSLEHYRGEGWYNDNPAYDYYSMWAFQMYGMLWNEWYGKKYFPEIGQKFVSNFKDVKNNYPYMFSRDGQMIMWGRSITYRFGSIVPFPLMGLENDPNINYGWMRRISSGVMLQFLKNPEFIKEEVPTLGFYGAFEPAIQTYSCRGSAFWMGKAFLCLVVPASNPFWTAVENEGPWENEMKKNEVYNKFQPASKILLTDYPNIGASEIRAWCHVGIVGAGEPFRGSENYNRLSYNSAFPWQADGEKGEVSMNYVFLNKDSKWEAARLFNFKKFEEGVYYRDVALETNKNIALELADLPLPNGILRVDRNKGKEGTTIRLGNYSLPVLGSPIHVTRRKIKGLEVEIIDNGQYQLATIPLKGWDKMETVHSKGLNPVSDNSAVTDLQGNLQEGKLLATLFLWKRSGESWSTDELIPVKKIRSSKGNVIITFKNGRTSVIKYQS